MIKIGDFIELEYTGKIKDTGAVFDTTNEDVARDNNIYNKNMKYGAITVCLGHGLLVSGLEEDILKDKEVSKEQEITLNPEKAFGKKDPKNLRLVPLKVFKDKNINPYPGLQLQIGESVATVKTVAGGRCIVDFNNPLSGKDVLYKYKIVSVVADDAKKVESIFKTLYGLNVNCKNKDNKVVVNLPDTVPKQIIDLIIKKVNEMSKIEIEIETIKTDKK